MMKIFFAAITALIMLFCTVSFAEEPADALTYAVFPYLPDAGYYREIIERRWAEAEPDIRLVYREWDCYTDGAPEGIDVIMYDAALLDKVMAAGWIQPVDPDAVQNPEDLYPFALEGLTVEGMLYGIPVFLCGNFLIYDRNCEKPAAAEHITDLADLPESLVVNSGIQPNRRQYTIEVIADTTGEANPFVGSDGSGSEAEDAMVIIDRLAIDAHEQDDDTQVVMAYDSGAGQGYIGFSESMRLLEKRQEATRIKAVSFSAGANIPRLYVDAVAITAGVKGQRYEKCLELINIMAGADVLTELSVQDGAPQYLLLARKSPYRFLSGRFPLYIQLEKVAGDGNNVVIRTP